MHTVLIAHSQRKKGDLVKPPKLERDIEADFVKKAKQAGWLCRKLNGAGARGWPDQLVCGPSGVVCFIEFKRPGLLDNLSGNQVRVVSELRALTQHVLVTDSAEEAYEFAKTRFDKA